MRTMNKCKSEWMCRGMLQTQLTIEDTYSDLQLTCGYGYVLYFYLNLKME